MNETTGTALLQQQQQNTPFLLYPVTIQFHLCLLEVASVSPKSSFSLCYNCCSLKREMNAGLIVGMLQAYWGWSQWKSSPSQMRSEPKVASFHRKEVVRNKISQVFLPSEPANPVMYSLLLACGATYSDCKHWDVSNRKSYLWKS